MATNDNIKERTRYPAKVLLFGEYTLLLGKAGLAVPFHFFGGSLVESSCLDEESKTSNRSLSDFYDYLSEHKSLYRFLHLARFAEDIKKGMWFGSNIPEGAGLGSSGALVAAIYDRYKTEENNNLKELKGQLALLERHFHGKSSGTDPLVSYLCTPLRIESNGSVNPAHHRQQNKFGPTMFLVDTAIRSKTNHLVEGFLSRWNNDRGFRQIVDNRYAPLVDRLAGEFFGSNDYKVWDDLRLLSEFQQSIFQPMIPDSFKDHFAKGLKSDHFLLKLCGSGGGGFMLGFTKEKGLVDEYFSHYHLPVFYIEH